MARNLSPDFFSFAHCRSSFHSVFRVFSLYFRFLQFVAAFQLSLFVFIRFFFFFNSKIFRLTRLRSLCKIYFKKLLPSSFFFDNPPQLLNRSNSKPMMMKILLTVVVFLHLPKVPDCKIYFYFFSYFLIYLLVDDITICLIFLLIARKKKRIVPRYLLNWKAELKHRWTLVISSRRTRRISLCIWHVTKHNVKPNHTLIIKKTTE